MSEFSEADSHVGETGDSADRLLGERESLQRHRVAPLAPPSFQLPSLGAPQGPPFLPRLHLQLEPPSSVKNLRFEDVPFPFSEEESKIRGQLAYTAPFRILSDAGVKAAREAIFQHKDRLKVSSERISHCVRGLGCVSNFHRELAHSPELLALFSQLARDDLSPHSMQLNMSHTNVGYPATGRPVDKWHTDAADYVVVIILSDLTEMEGGELQVLQMPDSSSGPGGTFAMLKKNGIPSELIETVQYCGAGYCIFMQGCKILHTVRGVQSCREPRISLVNSYMSTRPFAPDMTRYSTYKDDMMDVVNMDYARHKAWRIGGQMQYLRDCDHFIQDGRVLSKLLRDAAKELLSAANAIDGKPEDEYEYI